MKKFSVYFMALALIAGSCARNESEPKGPEEVPGTVVFEISTDDANMTRGGNIYGAEAQSNVAQVVVLAFKESATPDEFLYEQMIVMSSWVLGATYGTYTIPGAALDGNYKFLAIGTEPDVNSIYNAFTPQEGDNFNDFVVALMNGPGTATPIFSGTTDAETLVAGEFKRVPITIKRAVAGIMIYVKDIPVDLDGKTPASLRLTTTEQLNSGVNLVTDEGTAPTAVTALITIPLTTSTEGVYNANTLPGSVVSLPFSQLGGTYVLPTDGVTLTLGLYDSEGVMIKEWPLNGGATVDLERNVLYSLGTKNLSTSLYGSDKTQGETDPNTDMDMDDDALNILSDQLVLVTVKGAWDNISNLTLE